MRPYVGARYGIIWFLMCAHDQELQIPEMEHSPDDSFISTPSSNWNPASKSAPNFANLKEFGRWFSNPLKRAIEMGTVFDNGNLQ